MPYFKNNDVNLLFIHIPKTGGTSLEEYFAVKYNIPLNNTSLFWVPDIALCKKISIASSLQHMTYKTICKYNHVFNVNFNNIKLLTIVRNPYERLVSDLFYLKQINIQTSQEDVFKILQKYLLANNLDNHNIPQHFYITTEQEQLIPNITILRTETLTAGMHTLGYKDFNIHSNTNLKSSKIDYYSYLNRDSIKLINIFYHYDFVLFNYKKIIPQNYKFPYRQ